MSNDGTLRPMVIDSTGACGTEPVKIDSVIVLPSAVDWAFKITDGNGGKVVLNVFGAAKESGQFFFPEEYQLKDSVYCATFTNLTAAYVYTK